ncbi:MAG: hypothetical protein NT172_21365, partial [Planctomycetota bacterium]|nr:hypothetical protein [Planctomycetota bacterium]
ILSSVYGDESTKTRFLSEYPIAAKLWSKSLNQCRGSYRFEWDENGKKQQKAIWTIDKMSNF